MSDRGVIRAGEVIVGDKLRVVDPITFERDWATVSHSETMPQPCVTVRAGDVELDCSESAPIANIDGEQILAPNTGGEWLPVVVGDEDDVQVGEAPKNIGTQLVQKITCENMYFLAGKVAGKYLLHHNVKSSGGGPIASYNYMPNWAGLKWGW